MPTTITLKSGEVIKTHTLVWGAGIQANPLAQSLGVEQVKGGRIPVNLGPEPEGSPRGLRGRRHRPDHRRQDERAAAAAGLGGAAGGPACRREHPSGW